MNIEHVFGANVSRCERSCVSARRMHWKLITNTNLFCVLPVKLFLLCEGWPRLTRSLTSDMGCNVHWLEYCSKLMCFLYKSRCSIYLHSDNSSHIETRISLLLVIWLITDKILCLVWCVQSDECSSTSKNKFCHAAIMLHLILRCHTGIPRIQVSEWTTEYFLRC